MATNAKVVLEKLLERVEEHEQRVKELLKGVNERIETNKAELKANAVDINHFPEELQREIQNFINVKVKKLPPMEPKTSHPIKKKRSTKQRETV